MSELPGHIRNPLAEVKQVGNHTYKVTVTYDTKVRLAKELLGTKQDAEQWLPMVWETNILLGRKRADRRAKRLLRLFLEEKSKLASYERDKFIVHPGDLE